MGLIKRLLLIFSLCYTYSCQTCRCVPGSLYYGFTGYQTSDLSTITLKRYAKGSAFNQLLDTTHFILDTDFRVRQQNDTLLFTVSSGGLSSLAPDSDWEIVLAAAGRTIRVQDIESPQVKGDCSGKVQCTNPILRARVDGQIISMLPGRPDLFIKK